MSSFFYNDREITAKANELFTIFWVPKDVNRYNDVSYNKYIFMVP